MGEAFDAAGEELRCTSQPEVMSTRHPADVRWMQYSTCNHAVTAASGPSFHPEAHMRLSV
jgi:hypothetical protein